MWEWKVEMKRSCASEEVCLHLLTVGRRNLMYGFTFYGKNVECSYIFYFNWLINFGRYFFYCARYRGHPLYVWKNVEISRWSNFFIIFIEVYFSCYDALLFFCGFFVDAWSHKTRKAIYETWHQWFSWPKHF